MPAGLTKDEFNGLSERFLSAVEAVQMPMGLYLDVNLYWELKARPPPPTLQRVVQPFEPLLRALSQQPLALATLSPSNRVAPARSMPGTLESIPFHIHPLSC